MKSLTKTQKGEIYILLHALGWSFFPILTLISLNTLSPIISAGFTSLIGCIALGILLTIQKKWSDIKVTKAWKYLLGASLLIGIGFYGLIFTGISMTTAGDASIIVLMEIFFSMLILRLWGKEKLNKKQVIGSLLMIVGAIFILFQGTLNINMGNLMILFAATLPAAGNYFMQKARAMISSTFIMFSRTLISGTFLVILGFTLSGLPDMTQISNSALSLIINGIFVFGLLKILWVESIHRIPITKALSLNAIAPAFTLIFAYLIINEIPTTTQILGFLPILFGVFLLTNFKGFKKIKNEVPLD